MSAYALTTEAWPVGHVEHGMVEERLVRSAFFSFSMCDGSKRPAVKLHSELARRRDGGNWKAASLFPVRFSSPKKR